MSRDTFFRFNRFVLLGGVLFSGVLPLVEIEVEGKPIFVQGQFIQLESILQEANTSGFAEVGETVVGFDTGIRAEPESVGEEQHILSKLQ